MNKQTYTPGEEPVQSKSHATKLLLPTLLLIAIALVIIISTNLSDSEEKSPASTPETVDQNPLEVLLYTQLPELTAQTGKDQWTLDDITFNEDKTQALLWMAEFDPEIEETLAREPEIILAMWDEGGESWMLFETTHEDFLNIFLNSSFKDSEIAERFAADADPKGETTGVVYGGYLLPWRAGLEKRLTWSVGHTSCNPKYYCTYAFDFADYTMFEILASKGGYVYHWKDTCRNGDSTCTNSITLQDRTTTPWTYQIYMHIANNSIPAALKQKGVYVSQGQKIANVDDTGYSTGHHLHLMVVEQTTLNACTNYCFGKAVDITFSDVDINWHAPTQGGRPRLVEEAKWYGGEGRKYYISGNTYQESGFHYLLFPVYK